LPSVRERSRAGDVEVAAAHLHPDRKVPRMLLHICSVVRAQLARVIQRQRRLLWFSAVGVMTEDAQRTTFQ